MRVFFCALLVACAAYGAAPLPGAELPPVPSAVSDGFPVVSLTDDALLLRADSTINVCVIKVDFLPDYTPTTTGNGVFAGSAASVANVMSQVENYYYDVSQGKLRLELTQYPPEDGAYTLDHQMAYYGSNDKFGLGQCELLRDAVQAADHEVDFSRYGAVIVMHAGAGAEGDILRDSPDDIHSMFVNSAYLSHYLGTGSIGTNDGVTIREGSIVPECQIQDNYGLGVLGTIAHEFGHQLGLPDLYNTSDGTVGIGGWGLMGYGQWIMNGFWPAAPSAWSRATLGWITPQTIEPGEYTSEYNGTVYRIQLNSSEYFLLENRQQDPDGNGQCGPHERDFGLPGSGLLIWHIDETRLTPGHRVSNTVNADSDHKGVDLEEADGIQDLDYGMPTWYSIEGSKYDPWKRDGYAWEFTPESTPSTDASWGGYTGIHIDVLDVSGNSMRFVYTREGTVPGWPVELSGGRFGPVLWNSPDGAMVVAVRSNGQAMAVKADGSAQIPMGLNVTAPPVVYEIEGVEYLLLCQQGGTVNLRLSDWTQAPGWPVEVEGNAIQAIASSALNSVFVLTDSRKLYRFNPDGTPASGSPTQFALPLIGASVFPHEDSPGLILATADGSLRRVGMSGGTFMGWPVHPGYEDCTLPVSGDFDRDGMMETAVVSGGTLWVYDESGATEPGFPVKLTGEALSDPWLSDLNGNGHLEILVETTMGVEAYSSSGTIVTDWHFTTPTDPFSREYRRFNRGIGGIGFALSPLRDGRVSILQNGTSARSYAFGDKPLGTPILHRFPEENSYRLMAMADNGYMGAFHVGFTPGGWHTGMDRGGEGCWHIENLPPLKQSEELLSKRDFFVWPNPVTGGQGQIRFLPGSDASYRVRIFNVAGEMVADLQGNAPGGAPWEVAWNTRSLSPGVYYVCLELESGGEIAEALFHAAVVN